MGREAFGDSCAQPVEHSSYLLTLFGKKSCLRFGKETKSSCELNLSLEFRSRTEGNREELTVFA